MIRFLKMAVVLMGCAGISACLTPSSGPHPAAPAVPSTVNASPEGDPPSGATTEEKMGEGTGTSGDATEATPSWTSSSAGSVGCGAGSLFAKISLEDRSPVQSSLLEFAATVKGIGEVDYAPLEAHALQIDRIRIIDPNPPKKGFKATVLIELNAWIDLKSTAEAPRTVVGGDSNPSGDFCETLAASLAQKRFQLKITHQNGSLAYEKSKGDLPVILAGVSGGPIEDYVFVLDLIP